MDEWIYKIAITLIPGVGNISSKSLIAYCGGAEAVFRERKHLLLRIPGIGEQTVNAVMNQQVFEQAEKELEFIRKYSIRPLFYLDPDYPARLKLCNDSPVILYYKGEAVLNNARAIALVGTRNATEYGKDMCKRIIDGLKESGCLVISGLAYGIDTWAHKAALEFDLPTVGVLGHGLDRIYPYANRSLAERMVAKGGLITEFTSGTKPDRENFPMRNRIIAGMSDAVVVVEAGNRGGALITADIANSYDRDVFAVPGRVGDQHSEGCNNLIKSNRAALIQTADDIRYMLNWDRPDPVAADPQRKLFPELNADEEAIIRLLEEEKELDIDSLVNRLSLMPSKAASALLHLEFENLVKCLPGKIYRLL